MPRELSLPDIAQMAPLWSEFVSPWIELLLQAAARGKLPLRFGGEHLSRPICICDSVVPGDVHYRMIQAVING
jgi:hypothetical protein